MLSIARIMDANANRSREALRVMEDAARFALNDESLCQRIKTLRHDLRAALDVLPQGWIEANRNTADDVGTTITAEQEYSRAGLYEVVVAAGKRLTEALRALEEASKTLPAHTTSGSPQLPHILESLRYRAYDADAELTQRLSTGRGKQWTLCVLISESLCRKPWLEVAEAAITGGADCIQLREKHLDGAELVARARTLIDLARPADVSVIINDRVDVALAVEADGVHLGTNDLSVCEARRIAGRSLLIGASTHDFAEAEKAVISGADYCGVGAIFSTALKPDRNPSGKTYLHAFIERYPDIPHLAIGGISPENIDQLLDIPVRGVAVSSCICASHEPAEVASRLKTALLRRDAVAH